MAEYAKIEGESDLQSKLRGQENRLISSRTNKMVRAQDLSWYKRTYLSFIRAIHQTQLVSTVAEYSLHDFPRGLPSEAARSVRELFNSLIPALSEFASGTRTRRDNNLPNTVRVRKKVGTDPKHRGSSSHEEGSQIAMHALYLMLALDTENGRPSLEHIREQFQILTRYQAVAMLFAHMDAFFGDTLRLICRVKPEVLRTGKQLTWETVLDSYSIKSLVKTLAEQFVYEFGWKALKDRLKFLHEKFGLELLIPARQIELLLLFEQRRHLIIHNGGVATAKYIGDARDIHAKIGRQLSISRDDVRSLGHAVMMLGGELCSKVAVRFLNARAADLTQIWMVADASRKRDAS